MKNFHQSVLLKAPFGYALHKIVYDSSGQPVDYTFEEINPAFEAFTGIQASEAIGKTIKAILPRIEKSEEEWIQHLGNVVRTGREIIFEQYSSQMKRWFKVQAFSPGEGYLVSVLHDITNEKNLYQGLDEFFNINLDLLCIADLEGNFIRVNKEWEAVLGYSVDDLQKIKFTDFVHPDDLESTYATMRDLSSDKSVLNFVNRYRTSDGSYRFIEWRSVPHHNLIYAAARDITESKSISLELASEKNRLKAVIEGTNVGTWEWNVQTGETEFNDRWFEIVGYNRSEFEPVSIQTWLQLAHPDDLHESNRLLQLHFSGESEFYEFDSRMKHKDGSWVWVLDRGKVQSWTPDGKPLHMAGTHQDITDRKRIINRIKEQSALITSLLNAIPDLIFFKNVHGVYQSCNKQFAALTGRMQEELVGLTDLEIFPREEAHYYQQTDAKVLEKLEPLKYEEIVRFADGSLKVMDTLKTPYYDDSGNLMGILGISRDITEKKSSETALEESYLLLKNLSNQVPGAVYQFQLFPDGVITVPYANTKIEEIYEVQVENLKINAAVLIERFHPEDRERCLQKIRESAQNLSLWEDEFRVILPVKGERWLHGQANPERLQDGSVLWHGYIFDSTESRQIEHALSIRESYLNAIIENLPGLVWLKDSQSRFLTVNTTFAKTCGYEDPKAILGKDDSEIWNKELAEIYKKDDDEVMNAGVPKIIVEPIDDQGVRKWFETYKVPVFQADGTIIGTAGYSVDISERKKTEEEIKNYGEFQALLVRIATEYINADLASIDSIINLSLADLGRFVQADRAYIFSYDWDAKTCSNTYEWCAEGITPEIQNLQLLPVELIPDWTETHQQGRILFIEDVSALQPGALKDILEPQKIQSLISIPIMNGGLCIGFVGFDSVKQKHRYTAKESTLLGVFAQMLVNVQNRQKAEITLQSYSSQLEWKNFELDMALFEAEAASKSKSEFLANVSHEIRTPMNSILGFSEVMLNTTNDEKQISYLKTILSSGRTLLSLINDILDLSKIEAGKMELSPELVNLRGLIEESIQMFMHKAQEKGLQLHTAIDPELPESVLIDELRLRQILINLIGNAIKFTQKGFVKITVTVSEKNETSLTLSIDVEDSGIGIQEKDHALIFESFSQQSGQDSRKYGGTGLGLAITKRLCELMNGLITLKSEPDAGTTFILLFKDVRYENTTVTDAANYMWSEDDIEFNGESIVVADDVRYNRNLIRAFLEGFNLNIYEAENGKDAVDIITREKPQLVFMDLRMPIMDGYRAAEALKRNRETSTIPLVALSASTMRNRPDSSAECFVGFIRKPVNRAVLMGEILKYVPHTVLPTSQKKQKNIIPNVIHAEQIDEITITRELRQEFQTRFFSRIDKQIDFLIMNELDQLATEMIGFAAEHSFTHLRECTVLLHVAVNEFDYDTIQRCLIDIKNLFV